MIEELEVWMNTGNVRRPQTIGDILLRWLVRQRFKLKRFRVDLKLDRLDLLHLIILLPPPLLLLKSLWDLQDLLVDYHLNLNITSSITILEYELKPLQEEFNYLLLLPNPTPLDPP